jgi:hypothetical protein
VVLYVLQWSIIMLICVQLLPDDSQSSVAVQKQILKIYFALTQFVLPLDLITRDMFAQWMEVLRTITEKDVPAHTLQVGGLSVMMLRIRDVFPKSEFFHPGSRIQGQKDSGSAYKNLSISPPKKLFLKSFDDCNSIICSVASWLSHLPFM